MNTPASQEQIRTIVHRHAAPLVNSGGAPSASQAPGGIVGVYLGGRSYFFPFGRINDAGDAPTPETIFGLGSVTKTFTTAILGQHPQLFDQTVQGKLPPGFELSWPQQPTFAQLATFTGGINPDHPPGVTTQAEFMAFINGIPYPGSLPAAWSYSDTSIGLLGQTLMSLDGFTGFDALPAFEWYTRNLLGPLGMHWTLPAPVEHSGLATAYELSGGAYQSIQYAPWCPWGTAGRMFSTAADMVRFIMAAVGVDTIGGEPVPPVVLGGIARALHPRTTMKAFKCPGVAATEQACGWIAWPPDPRYRSMIRGKDGGVPGVSSYLAVNPELRYGVIFMTNMFKVPVQCPTVAMMYDLLQVAAGGIAVERMVDAAV